MKKIDYSVEEQKRINDWFTWINQKLMPAFNTLQQKVSAIEQVNKQQDNKQQQIDAALEGLKNLGQTIKKAENSTATKTETPS